MPPPPTEGEVATGSEPGATPGRPAATSSSSSTSKAQSPEPGRSTSSASNRRESIGQRVRSASIRILEANPPVGMWSATGQIAAKAPSLSELRGSTYSQPGQRRESLSSAQSATIAEHESRDQRVSHASTNGEPFITPLQTPLALAHDDHLTNNHTEQGVATTTPRAKSNAGTEDSDHTIQRDMGMDADLIPALAMMSHEASVTEIGASDTVNKRDESATSTLKQSEDSTRRNSILGRIFKSKETEPVDDLDSAAPKRRSKNLDKFFGEKGASSASAATKVAAPEKRRTRDFADMVEGNGDDFPELLFGRDTMNTQSYDPSQKRVSGAQATHGEAPLAEKTAAARARLAQDVQAEPTSIRTVATDALQSSTAGATGGDSTADNEVEEDVDWNEFMRGVDERPALRSKRASKDVSKFFGADPDSVPGAPAQVTSSTAQAARTSEAQSPEEEEEEEVDWDEFMRGIDERPPRRSVRISGDISKFFGEDSEVPSDAHKRTSRVMPTVEDEVATTGATSSAAKRLSGIRTHINPIILNKGRGTQEPATKTAVIAAQTEKGTAASMDEDYTYPTGYQFPPKKSAWQGFLAGLKAFWGFAITPLGFFVTLYGLLVVAWGGMLFLLLVNASPAMCTLGNGTYDCNNINSPRREWIEIDSQVVNALFCVTGFGLIPWRFRDLYFLLQYRISHSQHALRRLGGFHNSWFRLPASDNQPLPPDYPITRIDSAASEANAAYPLPLNRAPLLPLTGRRAPATPLWKLDFVVWGFIANTALQAVLSGFMWGLNRYNRPSWSTGLFVALACIVAGCAGIVQFVEGRKVKRVEGIPWDDGRELDREMGFKNLGADAEDATSGTGKRGAVE